MSKTEDHAAPPLAVDEVWESGYGQGWLDAVSALITSCEDELGGSGLRDLFAQSRPTPTPTPDDAEGKG